MPIPKYQLIDPLGKEELALLERDILRRGIQVPIEFDESGAVLDGHHRLAIAEKHGLEYGYVTRRFKTEDEKKTHVLMLNMARRQMQPHQWGGAFKKLLELKGVKRGSGATNRHNSTGATVAVVAEELGVPERTAEHRLAQHDAYEKLSVKEKTAVDVGEKSISSVVRKTQQEKNRMEAASSATLTGKFSVVYADPPWRYGSATVTGSAESHYPTMSTEEICELPVRNHVTKNAALFLWATNPLLEDAVSVLESWGFNYKTNMAWVKDKATSGLGQYVRGKHELLLIATRGSMVPEASARPTSIIETPRGRHSKKPEQVYALIEKLYPGQKYLELFARAKRKNWEAFGNEID